LASANNDDDEAMTTCRNDASGSERAGGNGSDVGGDVMDGDDGDGDGRQRR